jgi:rod shape-determining protein MreD
MAKYKIPVIFLVHVIFLFTIYVLQSMVFIYLPINRIVPLLLPIAVAGIAVFEGSSRGGGYGLIAGMLCDISFNQPIAEMTVFLTLVGITIGALSETIMAKGFPSFFICCLAALGLTAFVQMFPLLFFEEVEMAVLLETAFKQTVYSMIFTFPMYFIVRALGRRALT